MWRDVGPSAESDMASHEPCVYVRVFEFLGRHARVRCFTLVKLVSLPGEVYQGIRKLLRRKLTDLSAKKGHTAVQQATNRQAAERRWWY